jgi:hypothetical protein
LQPIRYPCSRCSATIAARTACAGDVTRGKCSTAKNRRLSLPSNRHFALARMRRIKKSNGARAFARSGHFHFGSFELSAGILGALLFLGFRFRRGSGWKLKDGRILTFLQCGQKNLLAVGHFKDIVMDTRLVLVPLPEDRGREPALDVLAFVTGPTKLDWLFEGEFGAGKDTNCRRVTDRILNGFKSDRAASEIVAYQFIGHNCGTGLGVLQAEVAH